MGRSMDVLREWKSRRPTQSLVEQIALASGALERRDSEGEAETINLDDVKRGVELMRQSAERISRLCLAVKQADLPKGWSKRPVDHAWSAASELIEMLSGLEESHRPGEWRTTNKPRVLQLAKVCAGREPSDPLVTGSALVDATAKGFRD